MERPFTSASFPRTVPVHPEVLNPDLWASVPLRPNHGLDDQERGNRQNVFHQHRQSEEPRFRFGNNDFVDAHSSIASI